MGRTLPAEEPTAQNTPERCLLAIKAWRNGTARRGKSSTAGKSPAASSPWTAPQQHRRKVCPLWSARLARVAYTATESGPMGQGNVGALRRRQEQSAVVLESAALCFPRPVSMGHIHLACSHHHHHARWNCWELRPAARSTTGGCIRYLPEPPPELRK